MNIRLIFLLFLSSAFLQIVKAQVIIQKQPVRCGTIEYYKKLFKQNPALQEKFAANQKSGISRRARQQGVAALNDTITLVIHIVGNASLQQLVTDAVVQSQVDVLNEDYRGLNADSFRIPAAFRPLYGKSGLTFKLAGTNPFGEPTMGIIRVMNNATYNESDFDNVKQTSLGGSDTWDANKYLNIWVTSFGTNSTLGISVFPGDPRPLLYHGFVCDYRAFGRGAPHLFKNYNKGRTTTHELGHFFNLNHIWGDDGGSCIGKDFPDDLQNDDTPNQGDATEYNPDPLGIGVVVLDNCSPAPPGIMYQNFLDYTFDSAMVMFTKGQQVRMQNALSNFSDRSPLLTSKAYQQAPSYINDASIRKIISPFPAICSGTFAPIVILRNSGTVALTSVKIVSVLNGGTPVFYNWTGNLSSYTETNVSLPSISGITGFNTLTVYTSLPNAANDENLVNDTSKISFEVLPVVSLTTRKNENFSSPQFPPPGWRINNPDGDETWKHNSSIGKNAPGSAWFNDWNNIYYKRFDDLISPLFSITNIDSVFLYFNLAAATYSFPLTIDTDIDTLSILVTKDCGNSFSTVYKKWGEDLQTLNAPDQPFTTEFFPTPLQWRRDTVNLGLSGTEQTFQVYFKISGNSENNIFIDDVSFVPEVLPAMLKEKGYLVYPTVFRDQFFIRHYQQPAALKSIQIFNAIGQQLWKKAYNGNAEKIISVNLPTVPAGVYFVRLLYTDGRSNLTQRILKQ